MGFTYLKAQRMLKSSIKRATLLATLSVMIIFVACRPGKQIVERNKLQVAENHRYLVTREGKPFFWLGDTGWLLFGKLSREEAVKYLEDRKKKGFNVIQVMVLHTVKACNYYGDSALVNGDVARPLVTPGNVFSNSKQYDFWDHVDYIVDEAAKRGLYMAMVPVWGTNVKEGYVNSRQAKEYIKFLAERYKNRPNIVWLNGGDIAGSDSTEVWKTIGSTLKAVDPDHLVTYHPRGRTTSSEWFHKEAWLDFNMFQSGHRRYDQDTSVKETHHFGEDNWKFIHLDYSRTPAKPTIDGEPSYEGIPQGLHDTLQPRWKDSDVRRYGYWSVFAGGFGYTYGQNSVMQMHNAKDKTSAYGSHQHWDEAINEPGAFQMHYLKELMLSFPVLERIPDQSLIANQGARYDYLVATRGKDYALVYTYTGRTMQINMGKIGAKRVKASWFNPRTGKISSIGTFDNEGVLQFDPPGEVGDGNDWVLILKK